MEEFIFPPVVFAVGLAVHATILKKHPAGQARVLWAAFLSHVAAGVLQTLLVLYYFRGGGDLLGYFITGIPMADALRSDFAHFAPDLLLLLFQRPEALSPFEVGGGPSTQSIGVMAGFILFFVGNSFYAANILVGIVAYASSVLAYAALKDFFPQNLRERVLVGIVLLPSAVFWSSAMLKEPIAMCCVGPILIALRWLSSGRRRVAAVGIIVVASTGIALVKPYILMALSLSAGVFHLWSRLASNSAAALKPFALVSAGILASAGLVVGSRYFVKGEGDSAASVLAKQRRVGYGIEGGSNFYLDSGSATEVLQQRTLTQELMLAPVALFTAFFRPFLFEAHNSVQLANGLEATMLLYLAYDIVRRRGLRWAGAALRASPALMFALAFSISVGLGTGMASSNLGTLSRYRAPMMPYFFMLLLVLSAKAKQGAAELLEETRPQEAAD